MSLRNIVVAMSAVVASVFAAGDTVDVVSSANWYVVADAIGSQGAMGDSSATSVGAAITLVNPTNDSSYDNYAGLGMSVEGTLDGVTSIVITYTSDQEILFSMGDSSSTYGYVGKTALAADTNATVTIAIPDGMQQSWPEGSVALNLAEVNSIGFDATVVGVTNIAVSSVVLNGYTEVVDTTTDTTSDTTIVVEDTTTKGEPVAILNMLSYYGAYYDSTDTEANAVATEVLDNDTIATLSFSLATGTTWASAEVVLDSMFSTVTHVEVKYSATADYKMVFPMEATGENGTAHFVPLPKTDSTVLVPVSAFKQPSWVAEDTATASTELDLSVVNALGFELADEITSGDITLSSIVLYGYPVPEVDTTDTTVTDTTVTDTTTKGEAVGVLNMLSYYGAYYDSTDATASATAEESLDSDTIASVKFSLAIGASWASAELALDSMFNTVTHVEIAYTASNDFKMTFPMEATGDNGTAHFVTLSKDESTLLVPVAAFKQPSWVAEDTATTATELDLSVVNALGFELPDGVASGDITITSVTLYGYPELQETAVKAFANGVSAPQFTGITGNKMNIAVPNAGRYTVSLFSLKGQKIGALTANLNAGSNQVPMNSIALGSQMLIVQIAGNGFNTVHKALIK